MATTKKTVAILSEQTENPDGSITIRPRRVADDRDIGAGAAAKMLGLHVKTVHLLCELGEHFAGLKAWKLPSSRGNAKWRINMASVLSYRDRRIAAARDGSDHRH